MSVNINRNLTDQFYRYKMPKLIAKVEGKGNGIKTVIVNMVEIAKSLNRPPMYPTKYFGCILGAQVNCDLKNERYIVNGSHESGKLQELLDGFIKKYVLCQGCDNPETVLHVNQKKGTISASCKACGHTGQINMKDKLSTYILKFPPDAPTNPGASVVSKKDRKKNAKKDDSGVGNVGNDSPDELNNTQNDADDDDDGDWANVAELNQNDCSEAMKLMTINKDLEKSTEERMGLFYEFTSKIFAEKQVIDDATQKEILNEANRLDIRDKAVIVICELLFKEPLKIVNKIKDNRKLFLRFTHDNSKSQKYLIRGFELTIKEFPDELLSRIPNILKVFFDESILEEDVLIEWAEKKKSADKKLAPEIHKRAEPFITWLKEADEETSDEEDDGAEEAEEEDDDDPLEVVYDERSRPDKIMELKDESAPVKAKEIVQKIQDEDGEEVDIDDI